MSVAVFGQKACDGLRSPLERKSTSGSVSLLHPNVFPQERRHVEVLTFDYSWLAFFETATRDWLELQNLLFGQHLFFRHRLHCFFFWKRFFLRNDQTRRRLFNDRRRKRRDFFNRHRLLEWNQIDRRRSVRR